MPEHKEQVAARVQLNPKSLDMLFEIGSATVGKATPVLPTMVSLMDELKLSMPHYLAANGELASKKLCTTRYGHHPDHFGMPAFELTDGGKSLYQQVVEMGYKR